MRFYYRIYQKTKVLTRKRKKKRTRATSGQQQQPAAKKLRTMDMPLAAATLSWNGSGTQQQGGTTTIARGEDNRMETEAPTLPVSQGTDAAAAATPLAKPRGGRDKAATSRGDAIAAAALRGEMGVKVGPPVDNKRPSSTTSGPRTAAVPVVVSDVDSKAAAEKKASTASSAGKVSSAAGAVSTVKSVPLVAPTSASATTTPPPPPLAVQSTTPAKNGSPAVKDNTRIEPVTKVMPVAKPLVAQSSSATKPRVATAPVVSKPVPAAESGRDSAVKSGSNSNSVSDVTKEKPLPTNGHRAENTAYSKKLETEVKGKVTPQSNSESKVPANKLSMTSDKKKPTAGAVPPPRHSNKEVVEISVEVSASDVKKVLEKKRAEKDAAKDAAKQLIPTNNGEERLYANYSIVDQIKKAGTAASLARQQTERASMMDFARSSEALANAPRVSPILQGLQPRVPSQPPPPLPPTGTEVTGLSAIVQNLAQKQQKIQAAGSNVVATAKELPPALSVSAVVGSMDNNKPAGPSKVMPTDSVAKRTSPKPQLSVEPAAKTLGAIVAPALSAGKASQQAGGGDKTTNTQLAKTSSVTTGNITTTTTTTSTTAAAPPLVVVPKLPGSTSIQAVGRDGKASPTNVETSGPAGQQMLSFYKSSFAKAAGSSSSLSEAAKSAESLTKNIPAGTTVTVKTIENKAGSGGKTSPSLPATTSTTSSSPAPPSSPKNSPFRMSMSGSSTFPSGHSTKPPMANPYSSMSAVSQASLMNPFLHSTLRDSMTMALAAHQQAQYLSQPYGALAAQMEVANFATAANFVRAAQAAAQLSAQSTTPLTTLEFTKSSLGGGHHMGEDRYGVLKIPQPAGSRSGGSLSSFGTSRLQVKVNADGPAGEKPSSPPGNGPFSANTSLSLPRDAGSPSQLTNGNKHVGTHSMPAILPFHGVKKVQALPKTSGQGLRPSLSSGGGAKSPHHHASPPPSASPLTFPKSPVTTTTTPFLNSIQSLTDSNPFKTSSPTSAANSNKAGSPYSHAAAFDTTTFKKAPTPPTPPTGMLSNSSHPFQPRGGGQPQAANNSLKKLAADLNTAQQKTLKGDNNILNALKKSSSENSSNKLADFGGNKGFGGKDVKKVVEAGGGGRKEVTTSS